MLLWAGIAVALSSILALAVLSYISTPPVTGLSDGQLRNCPDRPNCVSSELEGCKCYIKPLAYEVPPEAAWLQLKQSIEKIGGRIEAEEDTYLWATYRSTVFRFVDDLECRLDDDAHVIHLRSASRAGYSDFGVNRRRIEQLRRQFHHD